MDEVRGQKKEAALYYERALAVDPNHPVTLRNLGAVLVDLKDFHGALSVLKRAAITHSDPIYLQDIHIRIKACRTKLGEYEKKVLVVVATPCSLY